MAFSFTLPLRIVQAVFAIIVLGLTGYVAHWWSNFWHALSPHQVNFLVFTSVWTILALLYLIITPHRFPAAAHKYGILAAEGLTMLFWFAGFIALAVFLSDRVCFGHVCNAAKAAAVFGALEWLFFAISMTLAVVHVFRTRGSATKGPAPEMAVNPGT